MPAKAKTPNRDTVTSVNRDGSRFVVHPADVRGRFTQARRWAAAALILVYILLPWIPINGHPAVFLNLGERRFHLFGLTLAFQDTWLLFFVVTGLAFSLFYVTALLGRVWCGWACPQTVFLEHVFRRIERWIEGDATARRRLDKAPWTPHKAALRGTKYALFLLLATGIAHIFLSYFVSLPGLWSMMLRAPTEHWSAFVFVAVATAALFVNFTWFREQLCIVICPYGRLQSALLDDHSLNVAYDAGRGEPRGKPSDPAAGDCIDCNRCVQVCPTGIDIRQGLQLECVGCANCIDACDAIMDRLKRPRGLIRYASDANLRGERTRWVRPRTLFYTGLLLLGAAVATTAFRGIEPFSASLTRMVGAPYYLRDDQVRNQYQIRLINKTETPLTLQLGIAPGEHPPVELVGLETGVTLEPLGEEQFTLFLRLPIDAYTDRFTVPLRVEAPERGASITRSVEFLGPRGPLPPTP